MFFPPVSSKTNVTSSSLISSAITFNRIRPMPIEYLAALCKYDRVSADYVLAFKDSFLHHTYLADYPSILNRYNYLRHPCHLKVMSHHNQGLSKFFRTFNQKLQRLQRSLLIQVSGWLIGKYDLRL